VPGPLGRRQRQLPSGGTISSGPGRGRTGCEGIAPVWHRVSRAGLPSRSVRLARQPWNHGMPGISACPWAQTAQHRGNRTTRRAATMPVVRVQACHRACRGEGQSRRHRQVVHLRLAVAADLLMERGPALEQNGHEPYACHAPASPGPGRPACVLAGELTGERRHPRAGYAGRLRRTLQAAVQGK